MSDVLWGVLWTVAAIGGGILLLHLWTRFRVRRGGAGSVRQMILLPGGERLLLVESIYINEGHEGRLSVRALTDGRLLRRVDAHETTRVLASDPSSLLCTSMREPLHTRDLDTLAILDTAESLRRANAELAAGFAPYEKLDPLIEEDVVTVLNLEGRRVPIRFAGGPFRNVPEPDGFDNFRNGGTPGQDGTRFALEGHPRAKLSRDDRVVGDTDFLHGELFGRTVGNGLDCLVLHDADLEKAFSLLSRVTSDGQVRWTLPLGRPAHGDACEALLDEERLVVLLRGRDERPMELVFVDLAAGWLAWRVRP